MLRPAPWLAQVDPLNARPLPQAPPGSPVKLFGTDITVILGVALALTAILFFWAFFIRKRPKRVHGTLVLEREKDSNEAHGNSGKRKRRKKRPGHPDNWGRNPTLGETGGLPPLRNDDPEETPSEPEPPPVR